MAADRPEEAIGQRVRTVMDRIAEAAARAGRSPESVRLLAATKSVPIERIREAVQAGVTILGENRLQEALTKIEGFGAGQGISWHFIGHLQRRKVKDVVGVFQMIHSVDSLELAREIDRRAAATGIKQTVLMEVNVGQETTKAGFAPAAVIGAAEELDRLMNLEVRGLMAVPPPSDDPERTRRYFQHVRDLAGTIRARGFHHIRMDELSMGMSGDFEVAIEEGATLVRIGTALFGRRPV